MIINGHEIPDPPEDPEERKRWKITYYVHLYSSPKEKWKEILDQNKIALDKTPK